MKEKMNDLQDELKDSAQKIWMAGLGAVTMAGEEGTKLFKNLVEKGEAFQSQEHPPVDKMKQTANDEPQPFLNHLVNQRFLSELAANEIDTDKLPYFSGKVTAFIENYS